MAQKSLHVVTPNMYPKQCRKEGRRLTCLSPARLTRNVPCFAGQQAHAVFNTLQRSAGKQRT